MYFWFVDQSQDPVIHIQGQLAENSGAVNGSRNSGQGDGSSSDSDSGDLGQNYRGSFRLSTVEKQMQVQILGTDIGIELAMHSSYKLNFGYRKACGHGLERYGVYTLILATPLICSSILVHFMITDSTLATDKEIC